MLYASFLETPLVDPKTTASPQIDPDTARVLVDIGLHMNVLWVSHFVPYPPAGGMLLRSFNLIKELSRHGEVDLLALVQPKPLTARYDTVSAGLSDAHLNLSRYCRDVRFFELWVDRLPLGHHFAAATALFLQQSYSEIWFHSKELMRAILQYTRANNYTVVHFDTIGLDRFRSAVINTPCTVTHHNIESDMMRRRLAEEPGVWRRKYFSFEAKRIEEKERISPTRYRANLVCSELDKERLAKIASKSEIRVVPNGVDTEFFTPSRHDKRTIDLLFVGGLSWYPNVSAIRWFIDEIWPILKYRFPQIRLDIVGASPSAELVDRAKSESGITVVGFVEDVRPYFNRSRIFICPIYEGGGTKLKMLDAFAMAIPTVAHPVSLEGISAVAGKHYLEAESAATFAEQVERLLVNEKLCDELGYEARGFVQQHFEFSAIGNDLADYYKSL